MSEQPTLSVIVPVYNPGRYLRACVESVFGQSFSDWELILVDDGSTDGSGEICREYTERDGRVVFRSIPNSGVSVARNTGLELARGQWLHFLDSDDYLEPDAYAHLLQIAASQNADAVGLEHWVKRGGTETLHELNAAQYGLVDGRGAVQALYRCSPFAWAKLFTRAIVGDTRFTPGLARGEDTEFARHVLMRAERVYLDSRPLYHYVQSEDSAVRGAFRASQLTMVDKIQEWIAELQEWDAEAAQLQRMSGLHFMCSIYFDMYADKKNWKAKRREVAAAFRRLYPQRGRELRFSVRVKFLIFYISPLLFCLLHRILHRDLDV
ncbi:MAG: glycosyltransferase [Clostridiales bacterium]|nr:glycosyltransferase [Clostridiales bacterium]